MKNKLSINESQGKSGNFFICTDDNKFILKTVNPDELELIRRLFLEKYVKQLNRFPESLVCRIYGLYRMNLTNGNDVLVILMRNVIGQFKNKILCKFDLKGSTSNRRTEFQIDSLHKIVLKDINFDEIEKNLLLSKEDVVRLRSNCSNDAYFLSDMGIMDYSLFVVKVSLGNKEINLIFDRMDSMKNIYNEENNPNFIINPTDPEESLVFNNGADIEHYKKYLYRSLNNNVVYIISIIDYLQLYNFWKYIETQYKFNIKTRPDDIKAISCVPPDIYCSRFIEYIKKITN